MTVATDGVDRLEQIELRQQAHYWQAQHARAVQREAAWKAKDLFCWSHLRRDFNRVQNGYPAVREWGQPWMTRINEIFHLNRERLKVR